MTARTLYPFPSGWYAVGFSTELPDEGVLRRRFMDQELVLYRTRSGAACAVDAFCPHNGAHLGFGGKVVGETLRCPFHAFRFDRSGTCVATGCGSKPPTSARLRTWPLRELHGILLLYHDPAGRPPAWELPALAIQGWTGLFSHCLRLQGHPQETTENSVDVGHFAPVHGFLDVKVLDGPRTSGHHISVRYAMRKPLQIGRLTLASIPAEFEVNAYGLGFSVVQLDTVWPRLRMRQFILATPVDGRHIDLRIAVSVALGASTAQGTAPGRRFPAKALANLAGRAGLFILRQAVQEDFAIWEHKQYLDRPLLVRGDGPLMRYRNWAAQFYPGSAAV